MGKKEKELQPILVGEVVDEELLPQVIAQQIVSLQELETEVTRAMQGAQSAQRSADSAYKQSTGFGHKKAAIESLQTATTDLAQAQITLAEAQKVSFEYQEKLSQVTKYLFGLGVTSLANNRTVVRQLELQLKGESKHKLGELAQQEICSVLKQLKAQEDIMQKQEQLTQKAKELTADIKATQQKDIQQDQLLAENIEKDELQDKLLAENIEKDELQDKLLAENMEKDELQDKLLAENMEKDEIQDRLIAEQAKKDAEHDRLIAEQAKTDEDLRQRLDQQTETLNQLEAEIEQLKTGLAAKGEKLVTYIAAGMGAIGIVLSILQYIL